MVIYYLLSKGGTRMKIDNYYISLSEFPDMISLVIPITGCPFRCEGCHSPEYQDPSNGKELTVELLDHILEENSVVDAIIFFGGDQYGSQFIDILKYVKCKTDKKLVLWTGASKVPYRITKHLSYIKVGQYVKELGGLDSTKTNQRFYKLPEYIDCTYIFNKDNNEIL